MYRVKFAILSNQQIDSNPLAHGFTLSVGEPLKVYLITKSIKRNGTVLRQFYDSFVSFPCAPFRTPSTLECLEAYAYG